MLQIAIQNLPNQEFSVFIGNYNYDLRFMTFNQLTFCDIYRDNQVIALGVRCMPNQKLIPYEYMERGGNFFFHCINNDYPTFEQFGITQFLRYATTAEWTALNE